MSGIGIKFGAEGEKEFKRSLSEINQTFKLLGSEMKLVQSQFDKNDNSVEALTARNEALNKQIDAQKGKIATLKSALENAAESFGENDKRTNAWRIQLNNAEAALNGMERELKNNAEAADDMEKKIEESGKAAERSEGRFSGLGDVLKGVAATMTAVTAAAAAAAVKIGKEVVSAYADYEQLVGGVDTLFKEGSRQVQAYASNAFKTSGLSANEYMETVTGFSASLIQSLGGDTKKAAEMADMAITDMSDNANKMGSDMASIQSAYQGFAKQNYNMLDNLKLGYGGTQQEMYRLLSDAASLNKEFAETAKFSIDEKGHLTAGYADIVEAIHIVQTEMGITGTTAEEAEETISGSIAMTKSAFENLIAGLGQQDANIERMTENVVNSFKNVINNIKPVLQNLASALPLAVNAGVGAVTELLPDLLGVFQGITTELFTSLSESLPEILPVLFDTLFSLLDTLLSDGLPTLLESLMKVAGSLLDSFLEKFPQLINKLINFIGSIDLGQFLEQFLGAVEKIAAMIAENLPTIVDNLVKAVVNLIKSIDWKELISSGMNILMSLLDGILSAIPSLIDALPQIIDAIIDFLTDPETVIMLVKGAVQLVFKLIEKLPEIFMHLISAIANIGIKLIEGLWEGISKAGAWLWEKITGFFGGIVDGIKGFFGIHSPSTLFRDQIGKNLALGIGEGFDDEMKNVARSMEDAIPTDFDADITANPSFAGFNAYAGAGGAGFSGGNQITQYFNVSIAVDSINDEWDLNDLVTRVSEGIADQVRRAENVYA